MYILTCGLNSRLSREMRRTFNLRKLRSARFFLNLKSALWKLLLSAIFGYYWWDGQWRWDGSWRMLHRHRLLIVRIWATVDDENILNVPVQRKPSCTNSVPVSGSCWHLMLRVTQPNRTTRILYRACNVAAVLFVTRRNATRPTTTSLLRCSMKKTMVMDSSTGASSIERKKIKKITVL
jgi:hypothetical protein